MKRILPICLALLLAVLTTGCGSSRNSTYSSSAASYGTDMAAPARTEQMPNYKEGAMYAESMEMADDYAIETDDGDLIDSPTTGGGDSYQPINLADRKIVTTMNLSLQTTDFDGGVTQLPTLVEGMGGYVQDSYVEGRDFHNKYYTRSANFTVRVPSDRLETFGNSLGGVFHIVSRQKSSSDITDNYYDVQARLDSLKIQEERLLAMLEGAGELQYLIQVEQALSEVRYQIESFTTSINRMNSSVDLSTVTIYIQEVVEYSDSPAPPVTFSQRISYAFGDSWEDFVDFCQEFLLVVIALLPFLIILGAIALVVIFIVRRWHKRHPAPIRQPSIYSNIYAAPPPSDTPPTSNEPPVPPAPPAE